MDMKSIPSLIVIFLLVFLLSCSGGNNERAYSNTALADTTSVTGLTGDSVKLVKTASLNFKVKDVVQSTRAVSLLAKEFGGLIQNQDLQSVEGNRNELKISSDSLMVITAYTPESDITARIPSANLEEFIYKVADLGYFIASSKINVDDRSLMYLQNVLKQKNRNDVLSQATNKKVKGPTTLQTIEVKDAAIEQQINNRVIDADVKYSTVNLNLFQNAMVRKETVANYVISDYQLPFGVRLINALEDGWSYFITFIIAIAHLWMFGLLTIAIIIAYKYLQHKRKLALINLKR